MTSKPIQYFLKRVFDYGLASILLIVFSPVIIFLMILLRIFIGSPVYFVQKRPGKNEKTFKIYKFRTMTNAKDAKGELLPDADRLTTLGKIVRKLSLDELPQLLNVLKGEMSFVGPRPLLVEYLGNYNEIQKKRHHVLPGITGWAQVNGRNAISWEDKFKLDVHYVNNWSLILDFKIVLLTIKKVLLKSDINAEGEVTPEKFNGEN